MAHTDDYALQRSPSFMSRSSGASTPPPTTPSLSSSSSTLASSTSHSHSHSHHSSLSDTSDEHGVKLRSAGLPRSNTARAYLSGTLNGQQAPPAPTAVHEKGMFAYQSKYLSRTASIQSLSNVTSPPLPHHHSSRSSISHHASNPSLPRLPTLQSMNNMRSRTPTGSAATSDLPYGSSRGQKRTTWAPGHRLPGSASVSSVDDIMGRFGGGKVSGQNGSHASSGSATPRSATPTFVSSSIPSSYSNYGGTRSASPTKNHTSSSSGAASPLSASGLSSTSQPKTEYTPSVSSATSWKSSLARTSTQKSDSENVAPFPSSSHTGSSVGHGNSSSSFNGALPSSASRRFNSTPSSPASYTTSSSYAPSSHGTAQRPLSPTLYGASSNPRNITTSPPPVLHSASSYPSSTSAYTAPLESEIMRSSISTGSGNGINNRPKSSSFHLGSVADLGHSSVGMLRNFREYAVQEGPSSSSSSANVATSGRESPSSAGLGRKFTVSGGGGSTASRVHRRTQTLPSLGDVAGLATTSTSSRERQNSLGESGASNGYPRSKYAGQNGTRLNMHGLDRLSERSDTSLNDDDDIPSSGLGLGHPDNTPRSTRVGRRMASDAGEGETGAIVIPGITVGSDNVAGLNGRLRLARQPTQTKYGTLPSVTVKAMEVQRQCLQAYEYLCHVSEAKEWLVACLWNHPLSPQPQHGSNSSPEFNIHSPSPNIGSVNSPLISDGAGDEEDPSGLSNKSVVELEEALRNGVALARLARAFMGEKAVPRIFTAPRPRFRHSDNINYFFKFTQHVGLPEIFCFELTDLYDAKNLPKVIYCIHALSHLLARKGLADRISDHLYKVEFTDEELRAKQKGLDAAGVAMPSFGNIGKQLAKEINEEPEETEDDLRERMLHAASKDVAKLQALIRGSLCRREFEDKQNRIQRATFSYVALQAQCRGKLAHSKIAQKMVERQRVLQSSTRFVTQFQAQARRTLVQRAFYSQISQLDHHDNSMAGLQALIRGRLTREQYNKRLVDLSGCTESLVGLQAHIRGQLARKALLHRVRKLRSAEKQVSGFQSVVRGVLARKAQAKVAQDVAKVEVVRSVGSVQAFARGALMRKRQQQQSKALGFVLPDVVGLQSQTRGFIARKRYWTWYTHLHSSNEQATRLQALLKGAMVRKTLYYKLAHYYHNMDKVVRVQALFRKKQQLDSYKQLMKGTNVPIATIKNFIHLLADNDNDYREEVEVEHLKKTVITKIRANQALEADVSDLDIKIALLVKNKMTLDDIERTRRQNGTIGQKQRNSVLAAAKDPFALASMDKATLRKLELYQQMFYLLQTKPDYLARLFFRLSRIEMGDRARKAVEGVVLTLFGYAQNSREEFLLLKLFQRSIHEEVMGISSLQEFVKGDFVFIKLVVQYGRGTKERKFLQDTLGPLVQEIVEEGELDLETDPLAIYRACIAKEEMEHGLVSQRPIEGVNHQKALEDPEVRTIFIRHLQLLRAKTDRFLSGIFSSTPRMPFGMRYIAREIFRALEIKFVDESKEALIRVVGHFLYYRYINPAIVAPEGFDVVSSTVGPAQRKNLAAISKMLNQVSVGRQFAEENPYLSPLNEYVTYGSERFRNWFFSVLDVPDAETQFNADEYLDHSLPHKPIIYISPNEIYSMHSLVLQNLDAIADTNRDPLRVLLGELGGAPLPASAELDQARAGEIAMTLKGKFEDIDDPQSEEKALFSATKRYVVYLLKVQPGRSLMEILIDEVTPFHEEAWLMVINEELATSHANAERRQHNSPVLGSTVEDVRNLNFRQLKARCLENMLALEKYGRVQRGDNFQDILNAIAQDIRNKHRKRIVRQREIQSMEGTIVNLDEKHKYLEQQLAAFRSFVDSTKTTIQKKGKRRLVIPFTSQYFHNRELARTGKVPKFGSYKYTAKSLADKGILLSIEGFSPRQYDNISLTISSDEVGVFIVEASMMGLSGGHDPVELSMDELLQAQFNGVQVLNLGGMAKCNLNLLLSLINKKFYS